MKVLIKKVKFEYEQLFEASWDQFFWIPLVIPDIVLIIKNHHPVFMVQIVVYCTVGVLHLLIANSQNCVVRWPQWQNGAENCKLLRKIITKFVANFLRPWIL